MQILPKRGILKRARNAIGNWRSKGAAKMDLYLWTYWVLFNRYPPEKPREGMIGG